MAGTPDVTYKTVDQLKLGPKKDMESKLTSILLLIIEVLILAVRMLCSILESTYRRLIPAKEKSVAGEVVLITGAGHGMGRELALQLSALGATIICVDINQAGNEETVKLIHNSTSSKVKAYAYSCDVSEPKEVEKLAEQVRKQVGIVTILINNAGIMPCHRFFTYTPEEVKKIFGVNVFAHIWLLQAFLPDMIERNHGHVVSMSSIAGVVGIENLVPYCASKFAVRGMIEALHEEIRTRTNGTNVKFTNIYPYMVDTGLCQKPVIRFPSILNMMSPSRAAAEIIQSMRRDILEHSIPWSLLEINNCFRLFPQKTGILLKDFLGSTVDEHDVPS